MTTLASELYAVDAVVASLMLVVVSTLGNEVPLSYLVPIVLDILYFILSAFWDDCLEYNSDVRFGCQKFLLLVIGFLTEGSTRQPGRLFVYGCIGIGLLEMLIAVAIIVGHCTRDDTTPMIVVPVSGPVVEPPSVVRVEDTKPPDVVREIELPDGSRAVGIKR